MAPLAHAQEPADRRRSSTGRGDRRLRARRPQVESVAARAVARSRALGGGARRSARALFPGSRFRRALHALAKAAARSRLPLGAGAEPRLPDAQRSARGAGPAAAVSRGAGRNHRVPARTRAGHAHHAAHAAARAGDPRSGARAARVVGRERIRARGAGPPAQARHHRGLPALAGGGAHAGHRRRQRGAAQREPARQRFAVPQRQDHAGPGAARARRIAGRHAAVARGAKRRRAVAELPELPAQPAARHRARECGRGRRCGCAHAGAGGSARRGARQPPRARASLRT